MILKDYKKFTVAELRKAIRDRYGDKTQALFADKKKLCEAASQDDGLIDEYMDRISRGN